MAGWQRVRKPFLRHRVRGVRRRLSPGVVVGGERAGAALAPHVGARVVGGLRLGQLGAMASRWRCRSGGRTLTIGVSYGLGTLVFIVLLREPFLAAYHEQYDNPPQRDHQAGSEQPDVAPPVADQGRHHDAEGQADYQRQTAEDGTGWVQGSAPAPGSASPRSNHEGHCRRASRPRFNRRRERQLTS